MNTLYPVFLRLDTLNLLIIGGGNVAAEKLHFILKNSPNAILKLVAKEIYPSVQEILIQHPNIIYQIKEYHADDLQQTQLVIAATNNIELDKQIQQDCIARNILINVADKPELCHFYLGSIVTKGNLKIAISTNGKSPTLAKRLREFFETILPDSIDELLINLSQYRSTIKKSLAEKVQHLNEITQQFNK